VDTTELERLVERSYPQILRAALVLTGDRWEAEDLAQETFLQAIGSLGKFAGKSTRETWLYSILLNLHRKRLRSKQRRWKRWLSWFEGAQRDRADEIPSSRMEQTEWQQSLWSAVKELPQAQQHAVVLRYSEDLPYNQIAEILACPIGTAKSRVHLGVAALRAMLGDRDDLPPQQKAAKEPSEISS
jgi:RNA polymerase sigma-70 factor (ECF subfamily)